ncbi:hypothetical protein FS837_003672, partial [Tulasnella sp. UAMH 9824]
MYLPSSSLSSPTLRSSFAPSFACQAETYASLDIFALAQTLLRLARSGSTPPVPLDIHQRLNSIEGVLPLGPIAEALDKRTRQCTAELEEFRVQLAEVVADTKELMHAIEEADTSASIEVSELRGSVLGLICSDNETASSPSVDTPPACSIAELPPDPILTPTGYSVRKPLPRANPIDEVVWEQPESPSPARRSSALFAMDPISRSDVFIEIPVGSYATKIKLKKERKYEIGKKSTRL